MSVYETLGGPIVSDWHRHFIGRVQQDSWGGVSDKDAERLFQLVLLHEAHDEAPAHSQENIKGSALAVDLATGIAVRMTATEVEPLGPARTIYDKAITKSGAIQFLADGVRDGAKPSGCTSAREASQPRRND